MSLRTSLATASSVLAVVAAGFWLAAPAQAATSGPSCFGSVGCAATTLNGNCIADEELVEQLTVGEVGQLYLYESPSCGTAWAQLTVDTSEDDGDYASFGFAYGYFFAAEIFYEPSTGGVEQFSASAPWDGTSTNSVLRTSMVPSGASFKACGGAPATVMGAFAPFDEDPLGSGVVAEPPIALPSVTSTAQVVPVAQARPAYNAGACTIWH